jgi:hypothetical protein
MPRTAIAAAALLVSIASGPRDLAAQTIRVDATPGHQLNSFRPARALGAGIDRMSSRTFDAAYDRARLDAVLAAGWGHVSYRLNTELHVEAWHWNPNGTWSDRAGRGYFTGSDTPGAPIRHSYGYPLPHRGFTRNEGTEAHGYSRLTDGDLRSYWKSNPYLTRAYTGEDDAAFPQWLVIDLEAVRPVNAIRIAWAAPYARTYDVQYWTGSDAMKHPTDGQWRTFPGGAVTGARGGTPTVILSPSPLPVRFVRVLLRDSSATCDSHGAGDRRNCVGYAVRELYLGTQTATGRFRDWLRHSPDQQQGATYCSSVDPWHDASVVDRAGTQTGLDLFYQSGVTRGQPAMIPVALLYDTPENAATEIAYIEKRGFPISFVEMGEEPDGQYMTPEHYAALYLQFATAIHRVDPKLALGGPAFTGQNEDILTWLDERGNGSWLARFIAYLKARGRLGEFAFLSFEHYPYPPCSGEWADLYAEPRLISHIMQVWRDDGLPKEVPLMVTEVNIAWQCDQRFVDVWGGLWLADYVGAFLAAGGAASFFFHYLPEPLSHDCGTWGTFGMLAADDRGRVQPLSQYFAAQLLTEVWVQPGDALHRLHPTRSNVVDEAGHVLVTAYAVSRPDGKWSLLMINKDEKRAHTVGIVFRDDAAGRGLAFAGEVEVARFGPDHYVWHADGARGYAEPDGPPAFARQKGGRAARFTLDRASLTVVTGKVASE